MLFGKTSMAVSRAQKLINSVTVRGYRLDGQHTKSTFGTGHFGPTSKISSLPVRIVQFFAIGTIILGPAFAMLATRPNKNQPSK